MPLPPMSPIRRVFISHGHQEVVRHTLRDFVKDLGLEPVILAEQPDNGLTVIEKLERYGSTCHFALILLTADDLMQGGDARARQNVIHELGFFHGLLGRERILLLKQDGVELFSNIAGLIYNNFDGDNIDKAFGAICRALKSRNARKGGTTATATSRGGATSLPKGVVSTKTLRKSKRRLSGEVFAVELLERPITLVRNKSGRVTVTIDRRGVKEMLISNEGKTAKTRELVTRKNKARLRKLDENIQSFLTTDATRLPIDLPGLKIRLRWPSGGILSIVTDASKKRWVPLFFRDIRPYGWNIALGTTERWFDSHDRLDPSYNLDADLNDPRAFMWREFLEETLVVTGAPRPGGVLHYKPFHLPHDEFPIPEERARQFYKKHCDLRKAEDKLMIRRHPKRKMAAVFKKTRCTLKVRSGSGAMPIRDVLVCFSLLDLGIEVVKVLEYQLEKGDWILDGEIRERHDAETRKTERELIRMPTALLSLDYLKEIFGGGLDWHRYTFGSQPSIRVARPPDPTRDEITLFAWDVKRRIQAVEGEWDAKSMKDRFVGWYDMFGEHFIEEHPDGKWRSPGASFSSLFVPGTAKILHAYFKMFPSEEAK